MNYVRTLFDSVNAMLSADQEPRREYDPSMAISIEIDALHESDDDEEDGVGNQGYYDEEDDDTDDVSLPSYQQKAEAFLGRPLEWITDLFFSMQRFKRGRKLYWIMDMSHPLARIIEGSDVLLMVRVEFACHKDMVQVVYQDELVVSVVDVLVKRFAAIGVALRTPLVMVPAPEPSVVVKAEGGKKTD